MSDCMKCDFGMGECTCGREAALSQVPAQCDCSPRPGQVWNGIHGARFIVADVKPDGTVGGYYINDATTNFFSAESFRKRYTIDPHNPCVPNSVLDRCNQPSVKNEGLTAPERNS